MGRESERAFVGFFTIIPRRTISIPFFSEQIPLLSFGGGDRQIFVYLSTMTTSPAGTTKILISFALHTLLSFSIDIKPAEGSRVLELSDRQEFSQILRLIIDLPIK